MKMFAAVMLSALTIPGHAQSILGTLEKYQKEIQPKADSKGESTSVKVDPVEKTKTSGQCLEKDQTSLPLAYIAALMMEKDGSLEIQHDSRSGRLSISSPNMISNCSTMIEWVPDAKVVDGRKVYSIEAKIKQGENCADGLCTYDVAKVEKGQFKDFEKVKIAPTMKGFEECLAKSGVIKDGKVVADAIYPSTISERFEGYKETGDLLFLSHGPSSRLVKPKYDKNFVEINQCDHYERITANGLVLQSTQDEERARIMAEKEKVRNCGEYEVIADFIERYQGYSDDLNAIRDALIADAVKLAAKNVADGKYTEEDLKALSDFEKYVLQPKLEQVEALYDEAEALPKGAERDAKIAQMKGILAQLEGFNKAPFLSADLIAKFKNNGDFENAKKVAGMSIMITHYAKVNDELSPSAARFNAQKDTLVAHQLLTKDEETFKYRTGQESGKAQFYANEVQKHNRFIQQRTTNFNQRIMEEAAKAMPGGDCYKWFRNAYKCEQEVKAEITRLAAERDHFNKQDQQLAAQALEQYKYYAQLEKDGKNYVARQNGQPVDNTPVDTTIPSPRPDNSQGYTFNFQGNPAPQGQPQIPQGMNPYGQQGMFNQQMNPYAQYQQGNQQNFMGQQYYGSFNMGANMGGNMMGQFGSNPYPTTGSGYSFNYQGGGMPQQQQYNPYAQYQQPMMYQQPQQNYWSNPYQAMGNFNMYGQYGYR